MNINRANGCTTFPQPVHKQPELFGAGLGKFCFDAGSTNLHSQKVSFNWPEFRPQSPVFSGPRVNLPERQVYAKPLEAMDPCAYGELGPICGGTVPAQPGKSCDPFSGWMSPCWPI